MAWDCGAGCSFVFSLGRHLVLNLFPFPPSTAQRIGEFYNNKGCATICINIGGSLHPAPVGDAPRTQISFRRFF